MPKDSSLVNINSAETEPLSKITEHQIVEKITSAVLMQKLPPNTKLSEPTLCESFGTSRMKVRRALLLLADQGIVDLHSNRGAFITCPNKEDSKNIFGARLALEPNLAHVVVAVATEQDYAKLEKINDLEKFACDQGDRSEAIRLSGEFHVQLAAATGNPVLKKMVSELVTRTSLIVGLFGSSLTSSCPEHEHPNLLLALKSKDANKAEKLMRSHLEHIENSLDLSALKNKDINLNTILRDL